MTKLFLGCILLGNILLSSCGQDAPSECSDFLALPVARQVEVFDNFPMEKQLHAYICDYRYSHPSNASLASALAERGETIVPLLIVRLEQEDEHSQEAIIHIFELMYERKHLQGREDIVKSIQHVISNMRTPGVKEVSQGMLKNIEGQISKP